MMGEARRGSGLASLTRRDHPSRAPFDMAVVRFLQISDLHLGRSFGWLAPDRRAERRAEQRRALEQAVREAIERGAHAILIPEIKRPEQARPGWREDSCPPESCRP